MQRHLSNMSEIIGFDFDKMGFSVPEGDTVVFISQPDRFKFIAHLNRYDNYRVEVAGVTTLDANPDTIEYRIKLADTLNIAGFTVNRYRVMRKITIPPFATDSSNLGLIGNNDVFEYVDASGNPTVNPVNVRNVLVNISALNPQVMLSRDLVASSTDIAFRQNELRRVLRPSYWRQVRFASRNLRR